MRVHRGRSEAAETRDVGDPAPAAGARATAGPPHHQGALQFGGQVPTKRAFGSGSPILTRHVTDLAAVQAAAGKRHLQQVLGGVVNKLRRAETQTMPQGCHASQPVPGKAPLVGIRGCAVPGWKDGKIVKTVPPSQIPRLPIASACERKHETAFADAFCADPAAMVHLYESLRTNNIYNTDLAASCYGPWGQGSAPKTPEERKVRATMNAALHATKTAITHLAVYRHLSKLSKKHHEDVKAYELAKADFIRAIEDKQASKTRKAEKKDEQPPAPLTPEQLTALIEEELGQPPQPPRVAMTVGACGNGKGKALDTYEANGRAAEYAMVFDAAGEAESTEVGPFVRECIRLGFPVDLIAVHRDYKRAADRVIERAGSSGRIVDLVAFARSHTCGVDNFRALVATDAFADAVASGAVRVRVFERSAGGAVVETKMTTLPEPTATTAQVLETALDALAKAVSAGIGDHVAKGCLAGLARTWRAYDQWFDDLPQNDENPAKSVA